MLPVKIVRSLFAVLLTCVIALNGFVSPVYASTESIALNDFVSPVYASTESAVDSFTDGFWDSVGNVFGKAATYVAICYAVDVLIAPVAPPVAAYLAGMCPASGAMVGGVGGVGAVGGVKIILDGL